MPDGPGGFAQSLNPCSNGMLMEPTSPIWTAVECGLNPCSNGMLMEQDLMMEVSLEKCLNPCSNGMLMERSSAQRGPKHELS